MKLLKLIFMVRFIKILEWISSVEEAATTRSVPMRAEKDTLKIIKDCHEVFNSTYFFIEYPVLFEIFMKGLFILIHNA